MPSSPRSSPFDPNRDYVPQHMKPDQIKLESGGRQFDKNGKPLVGRHPDGSLPPPNQRAFGVGQIQIATAKETALRHGIPFNEQRLLTDRNYNLRLADLHMGDLKNQFGGDEILARAAYHSGAQTVQNAIQRFGRDNFHLGLGPAGRAYIGRGDIGQGAGRITRVSRDVGAGFRPEISKIFESDATVQIDDTNQSGEIQMPNGIEQVDPNPGARQIFRTNRANPVVNPEDAAPVFQQRAARIEGVLADQDAAIQQQEQRLQVLQSDRRDRLETSANLLRAVFDQNLAANRQALQELTPVIEAKDKIDRRLAELATENPIERGFRGIFDLNHNSRFLRETSQELGQAIQQRAANYQQIAQLQQDFVQNLTNRDNVEGQLDTLTFAEMDETNKIIGLTLANAVDSFNNVNSVIGANDAVIQSRIQSRNAFLDEQGPTQIMQLLEVAQKSPDGFVTSNGVTIGVGELQKRAVRWQELQMGLESAALALESGRLELAEKQAENVVKFMSESQLREAAANGGVIEHNGQTIQLPVAQINRALNDHNISAQQQAEGIAMQGADTRLGMQTKQFLQQAAVARGRVASMLGSTNGNLPPAVSSQFAKIYNQITVAMKKLDQAQKAGSNVAQALAPQIAQEIQILQQQHDGLIENIASQFSGGDKNVTAALGQYLRGFDLQPNQAIDALIAMTDSGSLPSTLSSSPAWRAAGPIVESAVREVDAEIAQKKLTKSQRIQTIRRLVNERLPARVREEKVFQFTDAIPGSAKQDGHAFGRVTSQQFGRANQLADEATLKWTIDQLGIGAEDLATIQSGKITNQFRARHGQDAQEVFNSARAIFTGGDFQQKQGQVLRGNRLRFLDQIAGTIDFEPSEAFIDYINSPEYAQRAQRFGQRSKQTSFADALIAAGDDGFLNSIANDAQSFNAMADQLKFADVADTEQKFLAYSRTPWVRPQSILGAIPGIVPEEETALFNFAKQTILKQNPGATTAQAQTLIRNFIVDSKFQDPKLERIRKIAAKDWDKTAEMMDRAIDRLRLSQGRLRNAPAGLDTTISAFEQQQQIRNRGQ